MELKMNKYEGEYENDFENDYGYGCKNNVKIEMKV